MNEKVGGVFIRKWSGKWITVIADRAGKIQSKKMLSNEEKDEEKTMATVSVYNNVYTRSRAVSKYTEWTQTIGREKLGRLSRREREGGRDRVNHEKMFQREKERTWVGAANNATSYCVYRPSADERPTRASTNFHPVPMDMGGVGGGRAFVRLWESQEEEEENRKGRINRLSRVDICMYVCMYGVVYCCCCPERYYISMWRNKIKYVKISRRIKRSRMGRVLGFFLCVTRHCVG